MDNNYSNGLNLGAKRVLLLIFAAVVIVCIYFVVSAIITVENTGVLKVTTSPKATISVSRTNSQAKIIGEPGKAEIRLKPGRYQVVAITTTDNKQAAKVVSVEKKQSTEVNLKLSAAPKLPTPSDLTLFGTNFLSDRGLTYGQMNILRSSFFQFKPHARKIAIDPQTIKTAPRSYNSAAPMVYLFDVSVDSKKYSAKIVCSDTNTLRLYLYNSVDGQQVFDSYAITNTKNVD